MWQLGRLGFRGDEAVYAGQAAVLAGDNELQRWFLLVSRGNSNFLLFQEILSLAYRAFGVSDVIARVVNAVLSTLTVPVVYGIGRVLSGRRAGWLAALALATSSYAVGLGRLALLDSTATLLIALALLFIALWGRSPRTLWLCGFGVCTALAVQAKVPSVLLVPVFALYVALSGSWRALSARSLTAAALTGTVALVPAAVQVADHSGDITKFLASSVQRVSHVPWSYYPQTLSNYEGVGWVAVVGACLVVATLRRRRADLLPALWLGVFAAFLAAYPLKGFNYALPILPALALLVGHVLARVAPPRLSPTAVTVLLLAAFAAVTAPRLVDVVGGDDSAAGMREAALWLRDHSPRNAGVMTFSHGSAQYVIPFYAQRDGYPFGRFRLDTVLPGGTIVHGRHTPEGRLPTSWVQRWPPRLIASGRVSYLLYVTNPLDDPPEESQVVGTMTQRDFRALIEAYGGRLVHTVYWHHEGRAYVYRVTKRRPVPIVRFRQAPDGIVVIGRGFAFRSPVTLSYHGAAIAHARADATGTVRTRVPVPAHTQEPYHLVLTDAAGDTASAIGLPSPLVRSVVDDGRVVVSGRGFTPNTGVRLTYHDEPIGAATTGADGTFQATVPLPARTQDRYRLRATDGHGVSAWTAGVPPPAIRYALHGTSISVEGRHFRAGSMVTLRYHGTVVGRPHADAQGAFAQWLPLPASTRPGYRLVAVDSRGRRATAAGLPALGPPFPTAPASPASGALP